MDRKKYSLYAESRMVYLGDFDTESDARDFINSLPIRPKGFCIFQNF
jgi:hypothetical protein